MIAVSANSTQERESARKKSVGKRLLSLRHDAELAQNKMAEKAGLTLRSYRMIEAGEGQITLSSLLAVCDSFGVELEWLSTGEGPKASGARRDLVEASASAVLQALGKKVATLEPVKLANLISYTHQQAWAADQEPANIASNLAQFIAV